MKPIETEYAGCRFRSRLEARWAVFFDQLGTKWQYEPQGYEFDGERYLPDFYLPEADQYVEVKGSDDQLRKDFPRLRKFASHVPQEVVLLGEIPQVSTGAPAPTHPIFITLNGETITSVGLVMTNGKVLATLAVSTIETITTQARFAPFVCVAPTLVAAYNAASSARFEHGEKGVRSWRGMASTSGRSRSNGAHTHD